MTDSIKSSKIDLQFFGADKEYKNQTIKQLQKGINSDLKKLELHRQKISNPEKYIDNWDERDEDYKAGIIKKWAKEVDNFQSQINMRNKIIQEKELSK